jgi:protein arginine N-methyltransferase 1
MSAIVDFGKAAMDSYSIEAYGKMIRDRVRTSAYANALRAVVRSHSAVLDIGTGTGILAFLACRFGARRVYAIEPGEVIELARQAATANGFADRIEFIQGISTEVNLPEKIDVIVSDIHGVLPACEKSLISIMDARDRLLAPGGSLIPQQDTLWAALVHAPEAYGDLVEPWDSNGYGFDFQAIRDKELNNLARPRLNRDLMVSEPCCWGTIDYRTVSTPNLGGQAVWTLQRATTVHGLAVWFDCQTTDGVTFSNLPGSRTENAYGQALLPWSRPCELAPGDEVSVRIRIDSVGEDYVWGWNTDIIPGADTSRTRVSFRQSTFLGAPLSPETLRKRARGFAPTVNQEGCIDREILQQMAEGLSLDQIAQKVATQFPRRFPTRQNALDRVADLSAKYSL